MMNRQQALKVALIDPVGIKAGMDHYDELLLSGIQKAGARTYLYTNYKGHNPSLDTKQVFFNTGVSKVKAVASNFKGFFSALFDSKKRKCSWLIIHIFRAGLFDLFTLTLARIMGFRICAIVHDVESLDTVSLGFVRRLVIEKLPHQRVVHNDFSRRTLENTLNPASGVNIAVIPHVHFIHIFRQYQNHPVATGRLHQSFDNGNRISSELGKALEAGVPVLLFFGQIKKAKGLELLLEAVAQCNEKFVLVIAGRTRDESWEHYENLITVLNIRDRVIPLIRFIRDDERDFLFSVCSGIILPYTIIYQSGVLLMAMSFPLPVIVSDLEPNKDIVKDRINGLCFKCGNSRDLAEKIKELLSDPVKNYERKMNGLEDVRERYNPERIGAIYFELLQQGIAA